jgi:hypothetical protein
MSADFQVAVYRCLAALYPKAFRDVYRDDLAATFALQVRDEGPGRVWLRTLRDLIITIPSQHMEARMNYHPTPHATAIPVLSIAVGVGVLAVMSDAGPVPWILLLIALAGLLVAVLSWQAARPMHPTPARYAKHWKKCLVTGVALLAGLIVALNVPPLNGDVGAVWLLVIAGLVISVALIASGIAMGVAQWSTRHRATRQPA